MAKREFITGAILTPAQSEKIEKLAMYEEFECFIDKSDVYSIVGLYDASKKKYTKNNQEMETKFLLYSFVVENTKTKQEIDIEGISQYSLGELFSYLDSNKPSIDVGDGKQPKPHTIGSNWVGVRVVIAKRLNSYGQPELSVLPHSSNEVDDEPKLEIASKPTTGRRKRTAKNAQLHPSVEEFKANIGEKSFSKLLAMPVGLISGIDDEADEWIFYCGKVLNDPQYQFVSDFLDGQAFNTCKGQGDFEYLPVSEVVELDDGLIDYGL